MDDLCCLVSSVCLCKQKAAYERRISDGSSDVCSSDLIRLLRPTVVLGHDPWKRYRLHPDHCHAGLLAVEGIVAARDPHFFPEQSLPHRSEERRVGKECVSNCRSRWSPYHSKNTTSEPNTRHTSPNSTLPTQQTE